MDQLSWWRTVSLTASAFGFVAFAATIALLVRKTKLVNLNRYEYFDAADELMNKPDESVAKPLVPNLLTQAGVGFALMFLGLSGLFLLDTGLNLVAKIVISSSLAVAGEICMSLCVYVYRLKKDANIIFIPKAVGFYGKVYRDIPAGKKGVGLIRIIMNGQVVAVTARSVDEVRLARGTDIKILYADDDMSVVVERSFSEGENPFDKS